MTKLPKGAMKDLWTHFGPLINLLCLKAIEGLTFREGHGRNNDQLRQPCLTSTAERFRKQQQVGRNPEEGLAVWEVPECS